jgi:hypothetical protein
VTELAVQETGTVATPQPQAPQQITTKSALVIWAEEARVVANIAVSIARTPFAGQLRGKPEEVTAVILAGNELGFQPMAALKSFDIIQGTPALRAHAMRGLVQSKGHKVQLVESDDKHCVMRGRRADDEDWQTVTWTIPRAALMGLVGKNEWKKQPQTMLVARATGELCRLIASDVLHGTPYTSEELRDSDHTTSYDVRPASAPLSVAAITGAAPSQPTPVVEPAEVTAAPGNGEQGGDEDLWRQEPDESAAGWPTVTQPGGGV